MVYYITLIYITSLSRYRVLILLRHCLGLYIYIPSNFEIIQIIVYFTCLMSLIFNKWPILFLWRSCSFFNNEGRQKDINNIKTWFLLVVNLLDNFHDIFWWAKHLKQIVYGGLIQKSVLFQEYIHIWNLQIAITLIWKIIDKIGALLCKMFIL